MQNHRNTTAWLHLTAPGQIEALCTRGGVLQGQGRQPEALSGGMLQRARRRVVGSCKRKSLAEEAPRGMVCDLPGSTCTVGTVRGLVEGAPEESANAPPLQCSPKASRVCETLSDAATAPAVGSIQLCAHD